MLFNGNNDDERKESFSFFLFDFILILGREAVEQTCLKKLFKILLNCKLLMLCETTKNCSSKKRKSME